MKNLHVIPTDEPSRLYIGKNGNIVFGISKTSTQSINDDFTNQNVYITSDEEIKQGDYVIEDIGGVVYGPIDRDSVVENPKKIILTTDQDLISQGIQPINDEFLEWFIKNPSCDKVEVVDDTYTVGEMSKLPLGTRNHKYKIIIPQEEPKQEVPEKTKDLAYWKANAEEDYIKVPISVLRYITELEKRMYSEEDLHNAFYNGWIYRGEDYTFPVAKKEWLNNLN